MICKAALDLIVEFEGCHRKVGADAYAPYLCPAGVPTVGFGSIWRMDGSRVEMTDPPISRDEAMALVLREVRLKCEPAVDRLIAVPLHPLSRGALVSFAYNLGAGALQGSGLRRAVNERRWSDVPRELAKWRMASGAVLAGLVRRRKAEADMFMAGVASLDTPWLVVVRRTARAAQ